MVPQLELILKMLLAFGSALQIHQMKVLMPIFSAKVRPEIKHVFRSPDQRPSSVVSRTFTVLCVLPLLILLIVVSLHLHLYSYLCVPTASASLIWCKLRIAGSFTMLICVAVGQAGCQRC